MSVFRPSKTGEHLGHYRLVERIGAGGMGTVYRAIDERTGTTVAVKLIHEHLQHDPGMIERFRREAHVAALLRSPYIVQIYEFGSANGRYFLASEFVEGVKLSDILRQGALAPTEALAIAVQVAMALDEAAARGVVHRDIKPDNIMVTRDNAVKVMDFGIARLAHGSGVTAPGVFVGTLTYAAPEQFRGQVDPRSDLYSLGCTLFHMLAGRPPFESEDLNTMMRLHLEAPPPMEALAHVPEPVRAVVAKLLAKDPNERYQSPSELLSAIDAARASLGLSAAGEAWTATATRTLAETRVLPVLSGTAPPTAGVVGPTAVGPPSPALPTTRPRRPWEAVPPRYRLLAAFGGAAALVAGIVLAVALFVGRGSGERPLPADGGVPGGSQEAGTAPRPTPAGSSRPSPERSATANPPGAASPTSPNATASPPATANPAGGPGGTPSPSSSAHRVRAGEWDLDLRVNLDTCGVASEGQAVPVTIELRESGGADGNGFVDDGEAVDVFDWQGRKLATGYLTWPTIVVTFLVANQIGSGEGVLWLEFFDENRGWASWTETYERADGTCVLDLEEPRPPGFVPGWERND